MRGSRIGTVASVVIQPPDPPPAISNLGTPVVSSRQWTTGLSPNATGDGWNYIAQSLTGSLPAEWIVIKNLTDTPTAHSTTVVQKASVYANITTHYDNPSGANRQLRAPNGRLFWPLFGNNFAYYDPTTEAVNVIGPYTESPPINVHASTIVYSTCFDTTGKLYCATQESENRPSCLTSVDTTTTPPTISVLGYFGSNASAYTAYGYYVAPDTVTATKHVYGVYGQSSWQLWDIDTLTGVSSLLYEVPAAGRITFSNIAGQGWVAKADTAVGLGGNVHTEWWCLDGAIYPYTVSVPPPVTARNVTPALNPLVNAPEIDTTAGIGSVGWRPHGSSGAYTTVTYTVTYQTPQPIEALSTTPDGVFGNAEQYQGFFRRVDGTGITTWFGQETTLVPVSQGPRLVNPGTNEIYICGYPDGVLYKYDPATAWNASALPTTNPLLEGYYGPSGIQFAGIKYASVLAWDSTAGRLYCAGTRERTGAGTGIGYWISSGTTFAGTFAAPLDQVHPTGLVMLSTGVPVMATSQSYTTTSAPLYTFDNNLNITNTQYPLAGNPVLGQIFNTATANVIVGVTMNGSYLQAWRYNINTGTLLSSNTTTFQGALGGVCVASDGSVWQAIGTKIVRIDPVTLAVVSRVDTSSIGSVVCLTFYGTKLYMTVDSTLYSVVP